MRSSSIPAGGPYPETAQPSVAGEPEVASNIEIQCVLAVATTSLNDPGVGAFDRARSGGLAAENMGGLTTRSRFADAAGLL